MPPFLIAVGDFIYDYQTGLVGFLAVFIYYLGRKDSKKDAAKLILQEMRYADQKVRNYRTYSSYNFAEKILPTNSWHKNINFFIRDLTESELDIISKFFSSASYLDEVIKSISDMKNKEWTQPSMPLVTPITMSTGVLSAPEKELIDAISKDIESIYNTPAADKLRRISEKRSWYLLYIK